MKTPFFDLPRPRFFAHRGSIADYPETPFRPLPLRWGPEYATWSSMSGPPATAKWWSITTDPAADLRRLPAGEQTRFPELRRLDAGFGFTSGSGVDHPFPGDGIVVPLLEEVLAAFPETFLTVEVKQESPAIEALAMETVQRAGAAGRILLATEYDQVMAPVAPALRHDSDQLQRGEVAAFFQWVQGGMQGDYRPAGAALQIPEMYGNHRLVSPETIHAAHAAGLEMHVWTVNHPADIRRLLDHGGRWGDERLSGGTACR